MKNTGILTIVMIAAVSLGIFALPSVLSAGTGQHTFNNGSMVNCNKCHALAGDRVSNEINQSGLTQYVTLGSPVGTPIHKLKGGTAAVATCGSCHLLTVSATAGGAVGEHTKVNRQPFCGSCHNTILTIAGTGELANATEPHSGFANVSLADRNAGCLGCHTAVVVSGTSPSYSYSGGVQALGLTIGNGQPP